jgi:hypothetical protein
MFRRLLLRLKGGRILLKTQDTEKIVPVIEAPSLAWQTQRTETELPGWIEVRQQADSDD